MTAPTRQERQDSAGSAAPVVRPAGAWLVDLLFFLFGRLSFRQASRLGSGLGWLLHRAFRFRLNVVDAQIRLSLPDLTDAARAELLRGVYRHLGRTLIEILRQPSLREDDIRNLSVFHGRDYLETAKAKGRGVLILAVHSGNWEFGLAMSAAFGYDLEVVVKEVKGGLGRYAVHRIHDVHHVRTIPRENSIFRILRQLRRGGLVGFVLDQNMTLEEGVFVDFFGRPACTMPGLAVLARRHGTPVVPIQFYRDADGIRQHAEFFPEIPWEEPGGDNEDAIRHNTARYTKTIEAMVRRHPDQWLWLHKRWKTQPPPATPPVSGKA